MTDYKHIGDDVRGFVDGVDHSVGPQTEPLARAYAAACNEVNARLRRCADLLRRGLRSEAIHLSQQSPDLLDVVSALDVPGFALWDNVCAQNDLTRAPRLLVEVAAELNDAYAREQPLQPLLGELRLLALARAPAIERVRVVRQLKDADPQSAHWADDLADLERASIEAMRVDAMQALRTNDGPAAQRMVSDLHANDWSIAPPADLVGPLTDLALRSLAGDLVTAEKANDRRAGKRAIRELKKMLARPNVIAPADVLDMMEHARPWFVGGPRNGQEEMPTLPTTTTTPRKRSSGPWKVGAAIIGLIGLIWAAVHFSKSPQQTPATTAPSTAAATTVQLQ